MKCFSIESGLVSYDNFATGYMEYGYDVTEHIHDGIEIVYVVSGYGEHLIDNNVIKVKRGSLIIMDYNCVHKIQMWETMKYYNVMFKAPFLNEKLEENMRLKELMKQYYQFDLSAGYLCVEFEEEEDAQRLERLFFEMLDEGIEKNSRHIEITRCHLDEIINLMLRNWKLESNTNIDLALVEAMNYIRDNSSEALRLEDVARKFNYKPGYFSKKLKEYCGMSFKQLLICKRLTDVVYDLCKTENSVEDIILKCGFTNKTYFYDVFKKEYGVKPKFIREYINNYVRYIEFKTKYRSHF